MSNLNTAPRRVLSIYVTDFPPAPPSLDAAFRQPVAIPDSEAQAVIQQHSQHMGHAPPLAQCCMTAFFLRVHVPISFVPIWFGLHIQYLCDVLSLMHHEIVCQPNRVVVNIPGVTIPGVYVLRSSNLFVDAPIVILTHPISKDPTQYIHFGLAQVCLASSIFEGGPCKST
ncbi:hypothetical protein C8J57DRAFT_1238318 [Mycena rebaudengoi]|nr:hypothetical protein C8J57DRAFT_1238318 [Mycena rebaudengoi]